MNDDLISRKAAIDEVKRLADVAWANWKETRISANTMIDALKDLPSAQPELIEKAAYIRGFEQGRTQGMIDTKAEEIAQTSLQPTCNNLATDLVSRKAVRDMVSDWAYDMMEQEDMEMALQDVDELPPAQDFHSDFADLRAEQEERNITLPVLHPVKET